MTRGIIQIPHRAWPGQLTASDAARFASQLEADAAECEELAARVPADDQAAFLAIARKQRSLAEAHWAVVLPLRRREARRGLALRGKAA